MKASLYGDIPSEGWDVIRLDELCELLLEIERLVSLGSTSTVLGRALGNLGLGVRSGNGITGPRPTR